MALDKKVKTGIQKHYKSKASGKKAGIPEKN